MQASCCGSFAESSVLVLPFAIRKRRAVQPCGRSVPIEALELSLVSDEDGGEVGGEVAIDCLRQRGNCLFF